MAQPIQVPQTTPNAPQFQVPTDLVNAYLQRKQNEQGMLLNTMGDLGNSVNQMHQQKIQNQLAALGAVSSLYGAGGKRAVQSYAPQINMTAGAQMIPPSGTPQNATLPPNQDQSPSPYIAASIAAGHPAQPGIAAFHAPQPTAGAQSPDTGQIPQWNAPQPNAEDLADIQSGGTYGRSLATSFKDLGDLGMQPLSAMQKNLDIQKTQSDLSMVPTEMAQKQQSLANAAAQIPMEKAKAVAGEASKQSDSVSNIKQIESAYKAMTDALGKNSPSPVSNMRGRIVGALGTDKVLGIPIGSMPAHDVNEAGSKLTAALSAEITKSGRYSPYVADSLISAMVPSAKETPEVYKSKLASVQTFLTALKSGNQQNIDNVVAAMGGATNLHGGAGQPQTAMQTISSDAAFKALPYGTQFKDPSGQVHRKK